MNRFASIFLFVFLLTGLTLGTVQTAHAQFGIAGGLNFESADDLENGSVQATLNNRTGYHLGVVYDFQVGPASVRPGVFYRRIGTYDFEVGAVADESFNLSAIEVPLDLRFGVFSSPVLSPYIMGGPMLTLPRGEDELDDALKDLSVSLNLGVGAELGGGDGGLRLVPELRYEFGATKFIEDDFEIAGQSFSPRSEPRFSAFSLRLHIIF